MKDTELNKFFNACNNYIEYLYFEEDASKKEIKRVTAEILNDAIEIHIKTIRSIDQEDMERDMNLRADN